jgi:hypothetical protein
MAGTPFAAVSVMRDATLLVETEDEHLLAKNEELQVENAAPRRRMETRPAAGLDTLSDAVTQWSLETDASHQDPGPEEVDYSQLTQLELRKKLAQQGSTEGKPEWERTRAEHEKILLALRKKVFVHQGEETSAGAKEEDKLRMQIRKIALQLPADADESPDILKAKHMHRMVQELDDGRRILFLTNAQAEVVAKSEVTMSKMLDAVGLLRDGPEAPKLVMNLLNSGGLSNERNCAWTWTVDEGPREGVSRKKPPFLSEEDERCAEEKLDCFMSEVLIPLAVRTNAIVIIHPFTSHCALSQSFQRMVELQKGKWPSGKLPFQIVTMLKDLFFLHMNPDSSAEWIKIRNQCDAWKKRYFLIKDAFYSHAQEDPWYWITAQNLDLNKNSSIVIVVDNIDDQTEKQDTKPYDALYLMLWRTLSESLPRIAIQTGAPEGLQWAGDPGMSPSIAMVQAKTPLIFLDLRKRDSANVCDSDAGLDRRAVLISKAKQDFEKFLEALGKVESGVCAKDSKPIMLWDHLICSNIAWFHHVLMHDGDPNTTGACTMNRREGPSTPMHEAIAQAQLEAQRGYSTHQAGRLGLRQATLEEINDVSFLVTDNFYRGIFKTDQTNGKFVSSAHTDIYKGKMHEMNNQIRTILTSPHLSFLNVHAPLKVAEVLVREIVRLDRLPTSNSLQGLLLVRDAWCEYDIVTHRANSYRRLSKVFFVLQLMVGWLIVVAGTVASRINDPRYSTMGLSSQHWWPKVVFGLTVFATLLISVDTLLNTKSRWRHLRSSAGMIEGILFQYRTRVGQFALDVGNPESQQPEIALCAALVNWRSDLVAGGNRHLSDLRRAYPPNVYRHQQFEANYEQAVMARGTFEKRTMKRTARDALQEQVLEVRGEEQRRGQRSAEDVEQGTLERGWGHSGGVDNSSTLQDDDKLHTQLDKLQDDYYSPMLPEHYVNVRLKEMLAFYQHRIPQYARVNMGLRVSLVLLAATSSILAAENFAEWALIVTSATAMITSYLEFSDGARKTERYTRSVVEIENLLSHWKCLPDAEKASTTSIDYLVQTGETIISEERVSWISTAYKSPKDKDDSQALQREASTGIGMNERKRVQAAKSEPRRVHPI